jgi:hydroxyacylglutathione hydrolase
MYFQHVYDKSLAQASYFIGCQKKGVAIVIDPKRDVDTYLDIARQNNMKITHIAETHIHADFLSGSRELAAVTDANLYLSDEGGPDWQYEFKHEGLRDGNVISVGNLKLEVLHTPGHTPESISFILTDIPSSDKPVMLFTGDFVFVGDVGRPDLLEEAAGLKGTTDIGARQLYKSLQRFNALPDYIQVWPGHGAGSACGKALGAVSSTTVGYEKIRNWALKYVQASDEKGFIKYLLEDQPEPPRYFAMMKKLNKVQRSLLTEVPKLKKLTKNDFNEAINRGIKVIDTRLKTDFATGFIQGSINIQDNNAFATWMGWFLSYDESFILIADESRHDGLVRKLMRIGLDNIYGYIPDVNVWADSNNILDKTKIISLDEFKEIQRTNHTQIIDLRAASEYKEGHIKGTENIFIGTLENNLSRISKEEPVVIHCQSGDRAAIGYSLLSRHGYKNVKNYSGGMNEWTTKGNTVETINQ